MAGQKKFQDSGFFGKNKFKKTDKHPAFTGKVDLSPQTLKELNRRYQDGEDIAIDLSGWRNDNDRQLINLKVQPAYQKEGGNQQSEDRSRGSYRRDDEPERETRGRSRDDDFPGDRRRDQDEPRRNSRRDEYGDEGDL